MIDFEGLFVLSLRCGRGVCRNLGLRAAPMITSRLVWGPARVVLGLGVSAWRVLDMGEL